MVFSKRLSYSWRLFFPVVIMLWVTLGVLVYSHYSREMAFRKDSIKTQIALISRQVTNAYESGQNLQEFLELVETFYKDSQYDDIMVSVYDYEGNRIGIIGEPIYRNHLLDKNIKNIADSLRKNPSNLPEGVGPHNMYYFKPTKSTDGRIEIYAAMPYNGTFSSIVSATPEFWYTSVGIVIAATIIAFFLTRFLSRSVRMLKSFTDDLENTQAGKTDMPDFPHDELGDISRRIIRLYREKDDAVKRGERQHQIALKAVNNQNTVQRQLTNNINHELKTPVGVIRGYLDTVLSNPDLDEGLRKRFLEKAQLNVERLVSLLDDLATMTRLVESADNIPMTDVDFHDLVFTLEDDIAMSGIGGNLHFSFDLPVECHVKGNYNLLSAMISNLVKNAALHSHGTEMGIKLFIESPTFYTFAFWDNGVGVETANLPRLFERFYRNDSGRSRKVGGTGLGLPIVKNTIEAHGGTISVHNRSDGGLEFIFTLPKWDGNSAGSPKC